MELTPSAGEKPNLIQISGCAKMIAGEYRRSSSQSRYPATEIVIEFFLHKTMSHDFCLSDSL